jgi:hypothetical protein
MSLKMGNSDEIWYVAQTAFKALAVAEKMTLQK